MIFPLKETFHLSEKFLEHYKGKEPNWGPLGYVTYKRTYARNLEEENRLEEWYDTVKRVVEGVYTIQLNHCKNLRLPWKPHKAQKSAQEMFKLIWDFKFLPPGRGLWAMGANNLIEEKGGACLNNCFSYETEIITRDGIKKIGDCVDTKQILLTEGGKWIEAPISSFGKQKLYRIVLKNGARSKKEIFATGDHRWFCSIDKNNEFKEFKTINLLPDYKLQSVITSNDKRLNWTVESVQETDEVEEVYCATVPEYGKFALSDNILTGNCAVVSTKDINFDFAGPFVWLMDMSMLGVGCSFTTEGSGKVEIKEPKISENFTFTVHDSKEGWCELIEMVLQSYVGKNVLPSKIDYSKIRPKGAPVKTFGGVCPGYEPLELCVKDLKEVLDNRIGEYITTTDIVDIMNICGKCVVSGGIRRTAELSLSDHSDTDYIEMKNPEKHHDKLMRWRWASNNSVIANVGMDYDKLIEHTKINGEPGYVYLDNMRKYGRMKDGLQYNDMDAVACNPCLTGDTLITVADGRNHVRIDEIEDGTLVYCIDDNDNLAVRPIRHPRITGYNKPIYKMVLDDGMEIKCTDNHKFRTTDNEYKELKYLRPGDSLSVLHKYIPTKETKSRSDQYNSVSYKDPIYYEHKLVAEYLYGEKFSSSKIHIHHKDGNKLNNNLNNIVIKDSFEHLSEHSSGENNSNFSNISNEKLIDEGKKLCKTLGRRFSNREWMNFAEKNNYPISFSSYRENTLGNISTFSKYCAKEVGIDLPDVDIRILNKYKKAIDDGYDAFIDESYTKQSKLRVSKNCETCGNKFHVEYRRREQSYCSHKCNKNPIVNYEKMINGQKLANKNRKEKLKKEQAKVYTQLLYEKKNGIIYKKDWQEKCKELGISPEISRKSSPFTSWNDLKEYSNKFNHRICSIEFIGYENVWNGTVDDYHNFFLGGRKSITKYGREKVCYCNSAQCGEQALEDRELCTLCETFPTSHDNKEDFMHTLKYAYLYAKTVTLVPTHNERTNQVMLRNRRIGLSLSGIVDTFVKFGRRNFLNWCDEGYGYIKELDNKYSRWLCIPSSIKVTTTKPSGTISLLPGVSPGIHYPHSEYYLRRIRVPETSPLVQRLRDANIPNEPTKYNDNNIVFSFPCKTENYKKGKSEVTMWEQMENAAALQYYWSDNNISQTVTVKPDELDQIKDVLELYETRIKTVSFLPLSNHQYVQAPYEEITEEEYNEMKSKMKEIDLSDIKIEEPSEVNTSGCTNDTCEIIDTKKLADEYNENA